MHVLPVVMWWQNPFQYNVNYAGGTVRMDAAGEKIALTRFASPFPAAFLILSKVKVCSVSFRDQITYLNPLAVKEKTLNSFLLQIPFLWDFYLPPRTPFFSISFQRKKEGRKEGKKGERVSVWKRLGSFRLLHSEKCRVK